MDRREQEVEMLTRPKRFKDADDAAEYLEVHEQAVREHREEQRTVEAAERYTNSPEATENRHKLAALSLASVARRFRSSAAGYRRKASDKLDGRSWDAPLPDAEFLEFVRAADRLILDSERADKLDNLAKREARKAKAAVVAESRVYSAKSDHSYYLDLAEIASPSGELDRTARAQERMARYSDELRYHVARRDKEGKRVLRILREAARQEDEVVHRQAYSQTESRALTTGGGATASASGGGAAAFVSPYWLLESWAPFRGVYRTFADQCAAWPLPEWGMQVYVPYFSTTDSAAQQTEGSAVTETDPTTALQGAQLQTVTGQVIVTQQLHERGFTGGGSFDRVMGRQLAQQLDEKLDLYVLNQVITNAPAAINDATVPALATFIPNLYADTAKAREQLTDTAGVRLRPTHLFSTSDLYSYVTRQFDNATAPGRPIVVPMFAPGFPIAANADDGPQGDAARPKWARFTGTVMPGGVLWFTDDNIPASGSNTQIIVSAPDQAVDVVEGDPVLSVFEQTVAGSLEVVVNLRAYVCAITRHASGSATIGGNAYPTSLV
jgi:hypothetical protein